VDNALHEIARLTGRHLYFLDDHLFGDVRFAKALFDGMRGMGRLWQAAATVSSVLGRDLLEKAVECGLRSLFVGFETLSTVNLRAQSKVQNLHRDYREAIRRLHGLGVMINGSFVFGMDDDDEDVFARTVEWAVDQGIETATFHILTPYPGTATFRQMEADGRILHRDWDLYDTRHTVFRPRHLKGAALEAGYWRAYRDFYGWGSILRGARTKPTLRAALRHAAYSAGWKRFEPLWGVLIRAGRVTHALPVLEAVLAGFGASTDRTRSSEDDRGLLAEEGLIHLEPEVKATFQAGQQLHGNDIVGDDGASMGERTDVAAGGVQPGLETNLGRHIVELVPYCEIVRGWKASDPHELVPQEVVPKPGAPETEPDEDDGGRDGERHRELEAAPAAGQPPHRVDRPDQPGRGHASHILPLGRELFADHGQGQLLARVPAERPPGEAGGIEPKGKVVFDRGFVGPSLGEKEVRQIEMASRPLGLEANGLAGRSRRRRAVSRFRERESEVAPEVGRLGIEEGGPPK
jgi:hypothetical protein